MLLTRAHVSFKDSYRLKVKVWKKDNPCLWKPKRLGVAIVITGK